MYRSYGFSGNKEYWILCNVLWFGLHLYAFHKKYNYSVAIHLLKLNLQRFANFVCNNDDVERFISCSLLPDTDVCALFFSFQTNIVDILRSPNSCSINVLMCQLLRAKAKKPQLYYIIQIMRESHRHHSLIRLIVKIDGFFMFSSELILKYESSHSVIAITVVCCACERARERVSARVFFVLHLNCYAGFFLFLSRIVLIALSLALLCVLCNIWDLTQIRNLSNSVLFSFALIFALPLVPMYFSGLSLFFVWSFFFGNSCKSISICSIKIGTHHTMQMQMK